MYLLTEWEGWRGKYLAWGQDVHVQTKRLAWPYSVNKHCIIWLLNVENFENSVWTCLNLNRMRLHNVSRLCMEQLQKRFFNKKLFIKTIRLLQRLIIGQFIQKSCFPDCLFDSCWLLKKLWTSFERSGDFLSVLLEWAGDWSSSALDSLPGQ